MNQLAWEKVEARIIALWKLAFSARLSRPAGCTQKGYNLGVQWAFQTVSKVLVSLVNAGIAQLVEQLICNQQVVGSNPSAGSNTNVISSMR